METLIRILEARPAGIFKSRDGKRVGGATQLDMGDGRITNAQAKDGGGYPITIATAPAMRPWAVTSIVHDILVKDGEVLYQLDTDAHGGYPLKLLTRRYLVAKIDGRVTLYTPGETLRESRPGTPEYSGHIREIVEWMLQEYPTGFGGFPAKPAPLDKDETFFPADFPQSEPIIISKAFLTDATRDISHLCDAAGRYHLTTGDILPETAAWFTQTLRWEPGGNITLPQGSPEVMFQVLQVCAEIGIGFTGV